MASNTSLFLAISLLLCLAVVTEACDPCGCPTPKPPSPNPKPKPKPKPNPSPAVAKCPTDTLKLGVCANVLGGLIGLNLGGTPNDECCSLLGGLADIDAAVCLCTTIKAGVLGINLNVPVDLSLLVNYCGKKVPDGYKCA